MTKTGNIEAKTTRLNPAWIEGPVIAAIDVLPCDGHAFGGHSGDDNPAVILQ